MTKRKAMCRTKKIRSGDTVAVISGSSKGLTGKIIQMNDDSVIVQGLNIKKKHVKPTEANPKGGIVEIEAPIHISNVRLADENGKPVKVRVEKDQNGERNLCYLKEGKSVLYRSVRTAK